MKKNILLLIALLLIQGCQKSTEPMYHSFYANAGPDQTTRVGSYAIIDASKSIFPDGVGENWFEWNQDENNPEEITIHSGNDDGVQTVMFKVEGDYKFHLTLKKGDIINNDVKMSNTDGIRVTVLPRLNGPIEDLVLESDIRYKLKTPLNEITDVLLLQIDSINCASFTANKVLSINGIEKCTNLKYLEGSLESIEDISPLSNLTNLAWIDLDQNWKISNVTPLTNLIKLKHLNIDGNYISDLSPLVNLRELTYLNVMYNESITDISVVHNLIELEELWLSNSPIENIKPIENLIKLKNLWLAKCEITDITPLKNLTELKSLFLKYNNISDISALSKLIKLERLYLSGNSISDISVLENLTNINWFILPDNQIEDIAPLVNNIGLGDGDTVDLSRNPLNDVSINSHIKTLRNRGVVVYFN